MRWTVRSYALRLLGAAAIFGGCAFSIGLWYVPDNPFTQWIPPLVTLLWCLSGLSLAVGVVAMALTSKRFAHWWTR
jgi:hypothetical protein